MGDIVEIKRISRAQFLVGAAAVGVAGVTGGLLAVDRAGTDDTASGADEIVGSESTATGGRSGLTYRGVSYEVTDGETPETGWDAGRMRDDLVAIKEDLGANSVSVFGDGVDRLAATASEAVERGLHVWLQPRLADQSEQDILDHLAETGRHAERLRRDGAEVHLSVGCEFLLFVPGLVAGADAVERIANLTSGNFDPVSTARRLDGFVARAAAVGRSVFGGVLTYGAAQDDEVDWGLFDVVSVDYYSYFPDPADYVTELRQYQRWGKPVAISEFGTCTYDGAPSQGGMGWDVVDYDSVPAEVVGGLVRSERSQADYLVSLLDVFESMNLYAATVYNFVTPDAPHRPDPRFDLDLASYGLVKSIWRTANEPTSDWYWEPKEAFHALARRYSQVPD